MVIQTHTPTHVNTFNRGPLIVLPLFLGEGGGLMVCFLNQFHLHMIRVFFAVLQHFVSNFHRNIDHILLEYFVVRYFTGMFFEAWFTCSS